MQKMTSEQKSFMYTFWGAGFCLSEFLSENPVLSHFCWDSGKPCLYSHECIFPAGDSSHARLESISCSEPQYLYICEIHMHISVYRCSHALVGLLHMGITHTIRAMLSDATSIACVCLRLLCCLGFGPFQLGTCPITFQGSTGDPPFPAPSIVPHAF